MILKKRKNAFNVNKVIMQVEYLEIVKSVHKSFIVKLAINKIKYLKITGNNK